MTDNFYDINDLCTAQLPDINCPYRKRDILNMPSAGGQHLANGGRGGE
jgi:hypothetical protein